MFPPICNIIQDVEFRTNRFITYINVYTCIKIFWNKNKIVHSEINFKPFNKQNSLYFKYIYHSRKSLIQKSLFHFSTFNISWINNILEYESQIYIYIYLSPFQNEQLIPPSYERNRRNEAQVFLHSLHNHKNTFIIFLSKKIDGMYTCTRPERKIRISRNVNKHYCGPRSASFASRVQKTHRR